MKLFLIALLLAFVVLAWGGGRYLVLDSPEKADVIVTLAGDHNDRRFYRALDLLRDGYGRTMLVDASEDSQYFGRTPVSLEQEFLQHSAASFASRVGVCPIRGTSTGEEADFVARCLKQQHPQSVLLVTSDYHTRRALAIFRSRLPQYHWSVAASKDDTQFGFSWWQRREWAKTTFTEWTKLLWWEAVDRWR